MQRANFEAILGFRTTKENRQIIENICKDQKISKSEFLRQILKKYKKNEVKRKTERTN